MIKEQCICLCSRDLYTCNWSKNYLLLWTDAS